MKLVKISKLEDCFDGSVIFQYSFNEEVEEHFMKRLGKTGKINYYPEFSRPFYKILTPDGLQIKGIIGEKNFEITYPQTNKWQKKQDFENSLKSLLSILL